MTASDLPQPGRKITAVTGTALPLPGDDIDTDRIIPARFLKCITFEGLGEQAFHDERYDDDGKPTDHPLNAADCEGPAVLIVGRNFGCGSSREHAPQSLMRYGIRAFVGESFGDIFAGNCTSLGMPAVTLSRQQIQALMSDVADASGMTISVDLRSMEVTAGALSYPCSMPESQRQALLDGAWDSTAVLLEGQPQTEKRLAELPYIGGYAKTDG